MKPQRPDIRPNHVMIGVSGTGKSRAMEHLIRQDIRRGYGVCVIAPQGEESVSSSPIGIATWLRDDIKDDDQS